MKRLTILGLALALAVLALAAPSDAGCFRARRARRAQACQAPAAYSYSYQSFQAYGFAPAPAPPAYAAPQAPACQGGFCPRPTSYAPATAPAPVASYGDPYGFTNWLNGVRAQYGLRAVVFDSDLAAWAASNNSQQLMRGMGHHVMGGARRQNSAMGSYESIGAMWLASPAHASALLDPSITRIGLAGNGNYWTFDAS